MKLQPQTTIEKIENTNIDNSEAPIYHAVNQIIDNKVAIYNKRRIALLVIGWIISFQIQAQCDISDQNFLQNCFGNIASFEQKNLSIRSKISPNSSKQYAKLGFRCLTKSPYWININLNLEINPSSNNYVDFYLRCDSTFENGYLLRLGDTKDELKLFEIENGSTRFLYSVDSGYFNRSKTLIEIRCIKSGNSLTIFYKDSGAIFFKKPIVVSSIRLDTLSKSLDFFGWGILQTGSSAAEKHLIKKFHIGLPNPDKTAPKLTAITWRNNQIADLSFDEPVFLLPATQMISNHLPAGSFTQSYPADSLQLLNITAIRAFFQNQPCNQWLQMEVKNLADTAGNLLNTTDTAIVPCQTPILFNHVEFSEIMSDPNPTLGYLPPTPYIEIYNPTNQSLWLDSLELSDALSSHTLPKFLLKPHQMALLFSTKDSSPIKIPPTNKTNPTPVLPMLGFPYLNQSEDILSITSQQNNIISQVHYSKDWHNNAENGGGYSLEKTDTACGCIQNFNWHSNLTHGGTPLAQNSTPPNPTNTKPREIIPLSPPASTIQTIYFPKPNEIALQCNNPIKLQIPKIVFQNNTHDTTELKFIRFESFPPNQPKNTWVFEIPDTNFKCQTIILQILEAFDCANRKIQPYQIQWPCQSQTENTTPIANPIRNLISQSQNPKNGDLSFNEVMFNNIDDIPDYIEIVNISDHPISTLSLQLRVITNTTFDYILSNNLPDIIQPDEYRCYSNNAFQLAKQSSPELYYRNRTAPQFPNLPASFAKLQLILHGKLINEMSYNEDQHMPLLPSRQGVSLEKNHPKSPSQQSDYWRSATQNKSYCTPADTNSLFKYSNQKISIHSKHFYLYPNNLIKSFDAISQTQLYYQFSKPGFIANAYLLTLQGIPLFQCLYNAYLDNNGSIPIDIIPVKPNLPQGNYILHIDAFHPDADICSQNLRVTVIHAVP